MKITSVVGGNNEHLSGFSIVVNSDCWNAEDIRDEGSTPGSGRYPGEGHSNPLQYSCPENSMKLGGLHFIGLQKVRHD